MTLDQYTTAWWAFVREWDAARGRSEEQADSLIRAALEGGLASRESFEAATAPDQDLQAQCEVAVVRASGAVDLAGYLAGNQDVVDADDDLVEHFCTRGWRGLRNPNRSFDVWWYWLEHLDPGSEDVNPLVHHLLAGRFEGLTPTPPVVAARDDVVVDPARPRRRVCLFAGYDVDGIIDDYVVDYIADLSRFCDVYYLADSTITDAELSKLDGITRKAWARPHGMYDFGSYAILARELVGWDEIATYDELVFANDSAYRLRSLDDLFSTMDRSTRPWWGLMAAKRDFHPGEGDTEPVPLADAMTDPHEHEWRMINRLHLGSYFLVFRKPVIDDPEFRRWIDAICKQPRKSAVILKYEVGLSQFLRLRGHEFASFVDQLYPYHGLYTADYFTMLRDGFPFLKRNLMSENPLDLADVFDWKRRVADIVPDADLDMFERNLLRVAADDRIRRSFAIRTREDGTVDVPAPLTKAEMREADAATPTYDHWWAFPVCAYDHTFAGNERAVFEEIRDDPSIKKIVLTRSRRIEAEGENVVVVPLFSPEGQQYVLRAKQIFVKHAPRINVPFPLSPRRHNFVNLWHGIPVKRFGTASRDTVDKRAAIERHNKPCRAVVTSSRLDSLAMKAAFYPLTLDQMWPTGLPRNDFVLRPDDQLPPDLLATVDKLRAEVGDRRLVMFLPTFKNAQEQAYYAFAPHEIAWLREWCKRENVVLGVREHMADRARSYSHMLGPVEPLNLSSRRYPDLEVLYRVADALVTDYSSCVVDFMLTGKPVISFAYDYERYAGEERGLFYDLDTVLPGPVCRDFDSFAAALERALKPRTPEQDEDYAWRRKVFFDHVDDRSSRRLVERVKALYVDGIVPGT